MTWLQGRIVERGSQGWKELRRSLVQPCAHSRLSSEVRPGLQLVRDENLQGWKLHDLSRKPVPLPDCPHGGIFFFLYAIWTTLVSVYFLCLSSSYLAPLQADHLHLTDLLPIGTEGCSQVTLELSLLQAECTQLPQPLLARYLLKRGSNIPWSDGCALVHTAQDTAGK